MIHSPQKVTKSYLARSYWEIIWSWIQIGNILGLAENFEQLTKFAHNFKYDGKLFNKSSRDASTHLVEKGSTLTSQEIRQKRLELQKKITGEKPPGEKLG